MEVILAFVIGALYAAAVYTMLRRSIVRLAIGLVLIGQAANLLIFASANMVRARPPIAPPGADRPCTHRTEAVRRCRGPPRRRTRRGTTVPWGTAVACDGVRGTTRYAGAVPHRAVRREENESGRGSTR